MKNTNKKMNIENSRSHMNSADSNEQKKNYNLKNDIIFKAFFGRKGNEEFLIDFLIAILNIKIEKIEVREEVNLEQLNPEEKGGRLDLQATLNDGIIVDIELQIENEHNIENRTTFYSSKVISMETERGTDYKDINQVIMINILDYELFGFDEYISETAIVLDKHRDYEVMRGIKWYFIELPKFRRSHPNINERLNQWLMLLDDYDKEAIEMAEKKNPTIKKAREEVTYLTGDEAVKRLEFLREKWEMDRISDINHAKEEGKQEEKIETARKLIKKRMDIELIIEITGLSRDEIEDLKKEKNI
ncbi:MAG: Rpn family recombination-promoting nuclease/putative transposase [Clostridia bacterium]|nr:Rpn family recombination-promoting nuclease/putative transposase [Clostridia bacterium]